MLSKLRDFSKSKLAGVLITIIIIPFVFWGMGSVFSGGNTNNVVKINNKKISTQDFIEHINTSNIDPDQLRKNLDKNVLEEILGQLISLNILKMEIQNLGIFKSDKSLSESIIKEKRFLDDDGKFSRIKYEKFLIENNVTAGEFERKIREGSLQKELFNYISGGIKSPNFITKSLFLDETKQVNIKYFNLDIHYKNNFTDEEINEYINLNNDEFKRDYIDVSYTIITPNTLTDTDQYNARFFEIIDDIENEIANEINFEQILTNYNLKIEKKENLYNDESESFINTIYSKRSEDRTQLIETEDFYVLYEITKIENKIPEINDKNFFESVKEKLRSRNKFDFNKNILKEIEEGKFNESDFNKLAENIKIKSALIKSVDDNSLFNIDSLKMLFTIPKGDFLLIVDNSNNIYLTKVENYQYDNFFSEEDKIKYEIQSNFKIQNEITNSYDLILNDKYKVEVYNNTVKVKGVNEINSVNIQTKPHPGFPTDLQAQFMSLMCIANGKSVIEENIFENRFMHIPELSKMKASIKIDGNKATVNGLKQLQGASVKATDLRASMSLIAAGLNANGESIVNDLSHLKRGYENFEEKLFNIGANIR